MSIKVEQKIIDNYWNNKIKSSLLINKDPFVLSELEKLVINNRDLSYFTKVCANNRGAEFTVLLSIYNILLQRYFETVQFISSSGIAENENTFLYKFSDIKGNFFKGSLNEIKEEVQEVFKYSKNQKEFAKKKSFSRYTPFGFEYKEYKVIKDIRSNNNINPFKLIINKIGMNLTVSILYDKNFIDELTASHFLGNYKLWIVNLESYNNQRVDRISLLSRLQREEVLFAFNPSKGNRLINKTIVDLFEEQAGKTPDQTALVFGDKELSYFELNRQANQLSQYLSKNYTINADDLIGIKLGRSEQLLVVILGILKTGAAYVPIDIDYPAERINYIEEDCQCKVVIDQVELENFIENRDQYSVENVSVNVSFQDLAYVIYTSGSTGNPKGVMVEHRNTVAMIQWAQDEFDIDKFDTVYWTTSHCFDLSIYEMFYPLSVGKKIRLLDTALEIGQALGQDERVLLNSVPSSIRNLIDNGCTFENVSIINIAGEVFPVDIANKLTRINAEVRNLYGPSEDTTYSTVYQLSSNVHYDQSISIGKPISNSFTYVLDDYLEPLPIGVPGDLYISGAGLSRGYLNNPGLTAERFITNPFLEGERMYYTGDIAKWLPDGNIEFLGRRDSQVKIRGYRIELEEIENTLVQFSEDVQQVVLNVIEKKGEKELVAYYISTSDIESSELRDFLKARLPSYMVPGYYMALEVIPLTPNGKIDRKALPGITSESLVQRKYVAPRNSIEKGLVSIWQEVLGIEEIGITDNFFELGGHSLLVGQIINRTYKQLNKSLSYKFFFEHPTVEELSKGLLNRTYSIIPPAQVASYYPLTTSQRRIWVLSQLEGGGLAYNIQGAVKLKGNLDIKRFKEAFKLLIKRHEILRTNFKVESGEIYQYIISEDDSEFRVLEKDLTNRTQESIHKLLQEEHAIGFDLANGSLLRVTLFKTQDQEFIFSLTMHHIIGDGWSLELLISEVITSYNDLAQNKEFSFPELEIQYKDYAAWLRSELTKESYKESEKYWLSQFQGELPVLDLPSFTSRPKVQSYKGKTITNYFSAPFLEKLKSFSKSKDATLFMTLMSGFNTLLYRYTNQSDLIVGTPIAGREHPDLEGQIGLYLNTLAIRTTIGDSYNFLDLLEHQKQALLSAYEHQNYPFDELVTKLDLKRDTSRSALFDVMVVLQNQAQLHSVKTDKKLDGIQVEDYELTRSTSQFDLIFTFSEKENLELSIEYNSDIYDDFLIERMFAHYENLMNRIIDNPTDLLSSIEYLTKDEEQQLLEGFNNTTVDYPKDKTIIELFEEQVARTPNHIAVVFEEQKLTYRELNEQANQLAHYLREKYAIQPDDLIGIKLGRSEQSLISIFGVLKSGAAYVPVDVDYPQDRINYIQEDSNCKVVIDKQELEAFIKLREHYNPGNLPIITKSNNLAYIIYTSGTTGKPKGVIISQDSLYEYSLTFKNHFNITEEDCFLQQASISFDTSVEEIFPVLVSGGTLVVQKNTKDFHSLFKTCEKEKISVLSSNPYVVEFLNQHLENYVLRIRTIISGGDILKSYHINNLYKKFLVYNSYGPTESTVCATYYKIHSCKPVLPIGKPINNRNIIIVDPKTKNLQPIGIAGEICISGGGLALGYLNNPGLTKEKFIKNPYNNNKKLYRSGDLARWLPNGEIEFLGRVDNQIKLRGYRIELAEIETVIKEFSDKINSVVVLLSKIGQTKELVAYYTSENVLEKIDLKEFLKRKLPAYMVPGFFVQLNCFSLTLNGKIDRKTLPKISVEDEIRSAFIQPISKTEYRLVEIWEEILGLNKIGISDNFFELGGHSLKITSLQNRVKKEFNVEISFQEFFKHTTIKQQSQLIEKSFKIEYEEIPKLEEANFYALSSSQRRLYVLSQFDNGKTAYNMAGHFLMEGYLNANAMKSAFHSVIERHEVLRTRFIEESTGEIKQKICSAKENDFEFIYEDMGVLNPSGMDLKEVIKIESEYNFNLKEESLIRAKLIKTGKARASLIFVVHHIICDGWSLEIIMNELFQFYNSYINNEQNPLLPLKIQYKDYAAWEQHQLSSAKVQISKNYWLSQFNDEIPFLDFPGIKRRPKYKSNKGRVITRILPNNILQQFKFLCQSNNSTIFMGLVAAVKLLLFKYTNQTDLVIGTPIAGREHHALQNQIGLFINTLALRTKFQGTDNFLALLNKIKKTTLGAYEHQLYPFDKLVSDLPLQRDLNRNPLFDVMVTLLNTDRLTTKANYIKGLQVNEIPVADAVACKFDLEFIFEEKDDLLKLNLVYDQSIFDNNFIECLFDHLKEGIERVLKEPDEPIYKLSLLSIQEENQLLREFNDTLQVYNREETFLDLFKVQVEKQPNSTAVTDNQQKFTYKELDLFSTQIANYINTHSEKDEAAYGVLVDRTASTIALLLGILKSGKAYIPLDPTFPKERLRFIIEHSKIDVLISTNKFLGFVTEKIKFLTIDEIFHSSKAATRKVGTLPKGCDTAYIIYTSGSTGKPKGVEISHSSLLNLLLSIRKEPGMNRTDSLLAVTTYSFDISILEFFTPLISGASIYMATNEILANPVKTKELLEDLKPTILQATPSFFEQLFNVGWQGDKEIKILCGGDTLSDSLAEKILRTCLELWNLYGPTETTIWSTVKKITKAEHGNNVGKPLANTSLYILDDYLELKPKGSVGRLFIGGDGLAKGYYKESTLTQQKFIKNPFSSGKIYETGDLVRWNFEGDLIFLGRSDNQVKIRGYRIELGDIEAHLNGIKSIEKAVVVAPTKSSGEKFLVAYFTTKENVEVLDLHSRLQQILPNYMIPSHFMKVDKFPLTPNKKINRKALTNFKDFMINPSIAFVHPNTKTEKKLVNLWQELLDIEKIGIKDNFFVLGGHSLSITRLASKIQKEFSIQISINQLFEHPVLEEQSRLIENIQIITQNKHNRDEETDFENFSI